LDGVSLFPTSTAESLVPDVVTQGVGLYEPGVTSTSAVGVCISSKNVAAVGGLYGGESPTIISTAEGLVPGFVTRRVGLYEPGVVTAGVVGVCIPGKDIAAIGGLLDGVSLFPISTAEGLVPGFVTRRVGLYEPGVIVAGAVGRGPSSKDIAAIGGLLDGVSLFPISTAEGLAMSPTGMSQSPCEVIRRASLVSPTNLDVAPRSVINDRDGLGQSAS
jgi:hypothetical protein